MNVFISYSHDSDVHQQRVRELAGRLREDGINAVLDQLVPSVPPEGWPRWIESQISDSDAILAVISRSYASRMNADSAPGRGLGAASEARLIQELYSFNPAKTNIFPVAIDEEELHNTPPLLDQYQTIDVRSEAGYQGLLKELQRIGKTSKAKSVSRYMIQWPQPKPGFKSKIADRSREIAIFERMVTGDTETRALLITGPAGMGKTTLLGEYANFANHLGLHSVTISLRYLLTLNDMLYELAEVLDLTGSMVKRDEQTTLLSTRVIECLARLKKPVVLQFDDYEAASSEKSWWLRHQLVSRLRELSALRVIVAGQSISAVDWPQELVAESHLATIASVDAWWDYASRNLLDSKLTSSGVAALVTAAQGNPGPISLILRNVGAALSSEVPHSEREKR